MGHQKVDLHGVLQFLWVPKPDGAPHEGAQSIDELGGLHTGPRALFGRHLGWATATARPDREPCGDLHACND
eukprot:15437493-Alexandrium_andersonii.AAC.1